MTAMRSVHGEMIRKLHFSVSGYSRFPALLRGYGSPE